MEFPVGFDEQLGGMRRASRACMILLNDLRFALRRLSSAPGFTAVAALTLALGIGATTAIYSVVDALMLRPRPFPDPERLVDLGMLTPTGRTSRYFDSTQLAYLKTRTDLFASVDGFNFRSGVLAGSGEPQHDAGLAVTGGMMRTLGIPAHLGRIIQESDAETGTSPVIVLSYDTWRDRFGSDPRVIGQTIRLDDQAVEVIGVMPRHFMFPGARRRYWMPMTSAVGSSPRGQPLQVVARLRADQSPEHAIAQITANAIPVNSQGGANDARLQVVPPSERLLNPNVRTTIYVLAGAVSLVLLIACANIANLLLVQNAGRDREVAVRAALGASRSRLLRQFLTEAVLLMCAGGLLGLLAAQWAIDLLTSLAPEDMTYLTQGVVSLDSRVLVFAVGLTVLTGILFGILPALKSSRLILFDALKSGARTATASASQERTRRGFVVVQLAIAVVLLIAATLLSRTFVRLLQVEPGFNADRLAVIQLQLPTWKYQNGPARRQFADDLLSRIRSIPGVVNATASGGAPPNATNIRFDVPFEVEGRGVALHDPALLIAFSSVPQDFFSVMGIPFKAGQTFPADALPGTPHIVINERMAAALWKGENPVGQRFRMGSDANEPWYTVVGVVGNVYQLDYGDTQGQMAYYLPASRTSAPSVQTWIVRTAGDPAAIVPQLRQMVRAMDPQQPIWRLGTFRSQYVEFFALPRFYTVLMGTFAAIGLLIAGVGLYGVLAYAMAQRTREFGIRVALGATSNDVLWLVLRGGAMLTAVGLTLGAAGSLIVNRSLASLLVDVPRIDPVSYALAIFFLAGTALAACWIPARRATRVDPVIALRAE